MWAGWHPRDRLRELVEEVGQLACGVIHVNGVVA